MAAQPELQARFADQVKTSAAIREQHGRGEGRADLLPPDGVLMATSTEDVAEALRIAHRHRLPVIPFGAGTSLEGNVTAPSGGLCIDLSGMDRIIAVRDLDLDCTVQCGVTREQLNTHLRDRGLMFPVDPGANATLGGMAATRASGTTTVRYGGMSANVLGLTAVLADGRVIRTGGRARKSSAGYDLTRLLIGSEGTLGVITELTLRLHGIPEAVTAAVCPFASLDGAVETVVQLVQLGVGLARMEFMDEVQVAASNRYSGTELPEQPTLLLEFHGTPAGVTEQTALAAEVAAANGGGEFQWAGAAEERTALWAARHNAYHAARALRPGALSVISDVAVPVSALVELVALTRQDVDAAGLVAPIVGHVGDGNFHVMFQVNPHDIDEMRRMDCVYDTMVDRALEAGGTCTGEHGIGLGKRDKLVLEHGHESVAVMRAVKLALDPSGILNPAKIMSDEIPT
ncbi:FAD-binding oxidoreductase [Sphingopyxis sp. 113P3]|uniref:FAD-binding oxidoreductase n=1 Tax=Sphingopyxis sp. (strain 113P3) TaxID=292913 RepID=UPI001F38EBAF|nr:FAD-linked oxidase C-terminal domain-containing protein [Sphingopyxis sp. 113P3]